jgi:hypothetical protein
VVDGKTLLNFGCHVLNPNIDNVTIKEHDKWGGGGWILINQIGNNHLMVMDITQAIFLKKLALLDLIWIGQ